jgi:tryptophan-rich sensory protein
MLKWFVIGFVAAFCFFSSFLILYHQKLTFGSWFQVSQVLHHETFSIAFSFLGLGILIGTGIASIIGYAKRS